MTFNTEAQRHKDTKTQRHKDDLLLDLFLNAIFVT